MKKITTLLSIFFIMIAIISCSRRSHPTVATAPNTEPATAPKAKSVKITVPKVITVNDKAAKRSVDGRYYYDLEGHRYWRNNRDGKYYLFHRAMFDDPDFKSPGN